jgi:DNA-binding HxlR family transcriptional regulator
MRTVAKTYCQYCPVAHALDVVGERWSLLIVRELLKGQLRYTDLAGRLPGIGTNILAARLRDLESAGVVVRRQLPPPTPVRVYELTEHGRGLQAVVAELARWGARSLGPPAPEHLSPGWLRYPLQIFLPTGFRGRIEFRVDGEVTSIVDEAVLDGPCEEPEVVVETDSDGFYHLLVEGEAEGLRVDGDESLLARFLERGAAAPAPA